MDPFVHYIYQPIVIENSSSWLPSIAVIIACAAVGVSLWSLWEQRKHNSKSTSISFKQLEIQSEHNEKSVRPVGHIELFQSQARINIDIANNGCGPMKIENIEATCGDNTMNNIIYLLPEKDTKTLCASFHTDPRGYWLLPGKKLNLFSFQGANRNKNRIESRDRVRNILGKTTINLTFGDVYDEIYPVCKKELSCLRPD